MTSEVNKGMVTCLDIINKKIVKVSKEIFDANKDRFFGTTSKITVAWKESNKENNYVEIRSNLAPI